MFKIVASLILLACLCCTNVPISAAETGNRVTILYDAFGKDSTLTKDWGFSALVEFDGKRILFDTGNNADIFAENAEVAKTDLTDIDFAVISHRHLDHTAGINHLLEVNPEVKIYAPTEAFGVFGSHLPGSFYRRDESLPEDLQYYDGHPPETMNFGTVWPQGKFEFIEQTTEIQPGIFLIALVSDKPGTKELRELSLAVMTSEGLFLVAGCSHPGIDKIVEAASAIDKRIYLVMGGFHMPVSPDEEISRVAKVLDDTFHVENLAPGHCTGEPAQGVFRNMWGDRYLYAGLGSVIELPAADMP